MTVDSKYYVDIYGGEMFENINRLLRRAEDVISCITTQEPEGIMQETCYKKAICAQAEYIGLCGGVAGWQMTSSNGVSFTVGSFSMSGGGSSGGSSSQSNGIAPDALKFLEKGGLCYRGAAVI